MATPCTPAMRRSRSCIDAQFDSTRRWYQMITLFHKKVPRVSDRSLWFTFSKGSSKELFTCRAAITTLMEFLPDIFPDRKIERLNALKVLHKLIDDGLIKPYSLNGSSDLSISDDDKSICRFVQAQVQIYLRMPTAPSQKRSESVDSLNKSATRISQVKNFILRTPSRPRMNNPFKRSDTR